MRFSLLKFGAVCAALIVSTISTPAADPAATPIKALFLVGGGHDMKSAASPDYLRLLANGLLWTCGRLGPDGKPVAGYAGPLSK